MKRLFMMTVAGLALVGGSAFALYPIFDAPVEYNGGTAMVEVVAADLDGDGDKDLATANFNSNYVTVVLNNGDGTFAYRVNHYLGVLQGGSTDIYATDFDGDGDIDLALSRMHAPSTVVIMLNNGDATFASPVHYDVDDSPRGIFTADFDGDSDRDIVTANYTLSTVSILENNGDGTFMPAVDFSAGLGTEGALDVEASDLDGDGDIDLAVSNSVDATAYVLLNNGDAGFAAPLGYATGGGAGEIRVADFDADGNPDLVTILVMSDELSVLENNGDGTFQAAVLYPVGEEPHGLFAADLDHDGYDDLMTANFQAGDGSVLWNNGDGTFSAADSYITGVISPNALVAADLDSDGNLDLAIAHYQVFVDSKVTIMLNMLPPSQPCGCCSIEPGDLDGSGNTDIADLIYLVDFMFLSGPPPVCQ